MQPAASGKDPQQTDVFYRVFFYESGCDFCTLACVTARLIECVRSVEEVGFHTRIQSAFEKNANFELRLRRMYFLLKKKFCEKLPNCGEFVLGSIEADFFK